MTKRKTLRIELGVTTGVPNFELCEFVESVLQKSMLGAAEYGLVINETKVTKESDSYEEKQQIPMGVV